MLLAGDEIGHTQQGNNNVYCQDGPLAWLNWEHSHEQRTLLEFVRALLRLRRTEPVFRRRQFFQGRAIHGADSKDLYWIRPDGAEMSEADWQAAHASCLALVLPGDQIEESDENGERIVGDTLAVLFNAHHQSIEFRLGARQRNIGWRSEIDTARAEAPPRTFAHMGIYPLAARSVVVLRGVDAGS